MKSRCGVFYLRWPPADSGGRHKIFQDRFGGWYAKHQLFNPL